MSTPSFPPTDAATRTELVVWIRGTPLVYGPWQTFKRLYKEAETAYLNGAREPEVLAALLKRFDEQPLENAGKSQNVAVAGNFGAMCVHQGFAYIWTNGRELHTYDLSQPVNPQLVATWKPALTDPLASEVSVSGGWLWVRSNGRTWRLNLANPSDPALDGELSTTTYGTTIAGGRVIGLNGTTLNVSEVRDSDLFETGKCEFVQSYYGLVGGPTFVAVMTYNYQARNGRYEFQFADLTDPANPRKAGTLRAEYSTSLKMSGENWVSVSNGQLLVYDLSDLDKPREIGKLKLDGANDLSCDGTRAAVLCQSWGSGGYEFRFRLVDLSDPKKPKSLGESDLGTFSYSEISSIELVGEMLYLATHTGLRLFDISDPNSAQEIGKPPAPATFAYLKRRGRRLLRKLSQTDDAAFMSLASAFFAEIAARPNLDWENHWIAADLVAANHPNWYQASHGRGAYLTKRDAHALVIKRLVERAPAAWDAHPETLGDLAQNSVTAPVVHLARQATSATAALSPAQIESYVASTWPNLRVLGARAALAADAKTLSPRAIAGALCVLNASKRRELLERAGTSAQIATELASFLGQSLPVERDKFGRRVAVQALTRRAREIALLLVARFDLSDSEFRADGALPVLRALLGSSEAPLKSLGEQFCRRLSADQVLPLVSFGVANAAVLEALMESAARADFDKEQIDKAVRASESAERAAAWLLVEGSQTSSATLNGVWMSLLRGLNQEYDWSARSISWRMSNPLQDALNSADARNCLVRGALDWREVRPRWSNDFVGSDANAYYTNAGVTGAVFGVYALFLPSNLVVETIATITDARWADWKPAFVAAIAPYAEIAAGFWRAVQEFLSSKNPNVEVLRARTFNDAEVSATFAGAAGQLAPDLLLSLIASVPDAVWQMWRPALLQVLQADTERRAAFWEAARSFSFDGGMLRARLIEDAEFAATFGLLESDVLPFDDPALEPLILLWLSARELDGETAIEAAIHPLPTVRAFGLRVLAERGLNVPIALRLLESDLRDAMETARNWFDSQTENIVHLALALCDSPRLRVREYGREFTSARLDELMGDGLLGKLEENPNAEMQSFVAQLLLNRENAEPLEFDRAVLRGRNRARRAKSLVQTRRAQGAPLPDDATLLELARGKTPRDAEWALEQLARRAMENEVAGVAVGGVGAI